MLRIYVAAAFRTAPLVRDIHARIRELGHTPTSTWAETANDCAEDLDSLTDGEAQALWETNHGAALRANIGIVIARPVTVVIDGEPIDVPHGRETFAEASTLLHGGALVVWIGRETLTARVHRDQTRRVATVEEALAYLERMPRSVAAGGG